LCSTVQFAYEVSTNPSAMMYMSKDLLSMYCRQKHTRVEL